MKVILILVISLFFENVQMGIWGWGDTPVSDSTNETTTEKVETEVTSPIPNEFSNGQSSISQNRIDTVISDYKNFTNVTDNVAENTIQETVPIEKPIIEEYDEKGCARNLFPGLSNYFNKSRLSDLEVVIGNHTIKVHQFVLSAKSSVFATKIQETYSSSLEMNDEDPNYFIEFLKFFYTEKFLINRDSDLEFIKNMYLLAKKYKVIGLQKIIEENMNKTFNLENYGQIFEFASLQRMKRTVDEWRDYVRNNSADIFHKSLYLKEKDNYTLECILYSMDINETQKLMALKNILRERRSDVNITRFKQLIKIPECNAHDFHELLAMNLFDHKELLNATIEKLDKNCQKDQEFNYFKRGFDQLLAERETLYQRNNELMQKCEAQRTTPPQHPYVNQPPIRPRKRINNHGNRKPINVGY